mmetsp:Transcript_22499/g.40014  ORF Transcript_22499/g.40014 Transcript_22499/m.40014 type:complete len:229 (+) Transcript_22499:225-911(+)
MSVKPPPFIPSLSHAKTHMSVMILSTTALPVRGSVHSLSIFGDPSLAVCSMVTTTVLGELTRSIAPPIPLRSLPGMKKLARSPELEHCIPPRIVRSTCPPRIMEKLSELQNELAPRIAVTVSLPALMKSASPCSPLDGSGYGPSPIKPFSACSSIWTPSGIKLDAMVGIPIPKFTYMPSLNSFAALLTILPRGPDISVIWPATVSRSLSILFSFSSAWIKWSTYTPDR